MTLVSPVFYFSTVKETNLQVNRRSACKMKILYLIKGDPANLRIR